MIYINPYLSVPINTIIGGVAGSISTKAALATKLAISESIINRFEIVGSDIHANISASYIIPDFCFQNDSTLTKYLDLQGKVTQANNRSLANTHLNEIYFPAMTTAGPGILEQNNFIEEINLPIVSTEFGIINSSTSIKRIYLLNYQQLTSSKIGAFSLLTACEIIDMRKLKVYATANTGGNEVVSGFQNLKIGCEIRVHINLKTADSGNPDRALNWVKNNRAAIVKFYDDDGNYVSTL